MFFHEIVGQHRLKTLLRNNVNEGRIAHATLLLGPEGCGALAIALAFAQYMMCENRNEQDSCGQCSACIKNSKMIHPDLHFMYPNIKRDSNDKTQFSTEWIKEWREQISNNPYISGFDWINSLSKGENKQGNITKADCHETIKKMSLKPYESPYKIQIIWLAEYLGLEGNTLLKLIEEPPNDTYFILVAEQAELILNTIISRTQIIKIPAIEDADMVAALKDTQQCDEELARNIARIADGNMSLAYKMVEGEENNHEQLNSLFWKAAFKKAYKQSDAAASIDVVCTEFAALGREKQKNFCKYALFFLRECLRLEQGLDTRLEKEELDYAKRSVKYMPEGSIASIQSVLNRLHYHIERNAAAKIQMMATLLQVARILAGENVALPVYV